MMLTRFIKNQLIIFLVLTVLALLGLGLYYLRLPSVAGVGQYQLKVDLPAAGGLYRTANVTYRGVTVGRVDSVGLAPDGVVARMQLNSSTAIPGRPSGVSSGASSRSIPASQPQAITEVAKPVIAVAAVRAQRGSSAVISSRVARIGNASANVSSIRTPLSCTGRGTSLVAARL